jgi:ubiquinone/menaquinone biosynthesis C-methylase UbiE
VPQQDDRAAHYDDDFYRQMSRGADRSAHHAVPLLIELLAPASVVDVGCGAGTWSAEFRRRGLDDVLGVDGPWVAIEALEIPRDRFVRADLTHPLGGRTI